MPSAPSMPTVPPAKPERPQVRAFVSSTQFDLLLACCAHVSRDERIREILEGPLDWRRLLELAGHHGVIPHLYHCLAASNVVPQETLHLLQQRYEANARQTLWLTRELLRILECLEDSGIRALPYKGPILAEILYGNVSLRQFSDLDLLIHEADLAKVKTALLELGYQPALQLTPRQERAYVDSGYEYTFDNSLGRNLLEMQWRILPRFYSIDFDIDYFFDRAVPLRLSGRSLHTLSREDLMLVLCVHAAKHAWVQLSWLCDIAELAQSVDWVVVQDHAQRLGIERIVAVTFILAARLLGTPLPHSAQEWIQKDRTVEGLADRILPIITQGAEYETESMAYFRLMMNVRECWRDRFHFLWRLAFTPSVGEWSSIRLPGPLFPLYRVVRLMRLAGRLIS
jgi:Uncharacterised nucleotidyltransferase